MTESKTLKAAFNQVATWRPDNTAFVQAFDDRRYTYAEANEEARQFANALTNLGIEKGDRVALLSQTTVDHAIAYFGTLKIGAIPATAHGREAPNVIRTLIKNLGAKAVVFQPKFTDVIEGLVNDPGTVEHYIAFDQWGEIPNFGTGFTSLIDGVPIAEPDVRVGPSDIAYINFSSGTTGRPKGIVHTHEETVECAHAGQYVFGPHDSDAVLNVFTPSFIGWPNMALPLVNVGGKVVFVREWKPEQVPHILEQEQVSICLLVPTQWKMVLQTDLDEFDLSSVRLAGYAGEAMGTDLFRQLQDVVTENCFTIYGTTETMDAGIAMLPHEVTGETLGSVGRPMPNVNVRIIEPDSYDPEAIVKQGTVGELIIHGPSLAKEIWNDPEKTAKIFHEEGWWFSGDLARVGDDGNIYIEGRTDNMIISGGINIYAEAIEGIIEGHPAVSECAVIGIPHEKWREAVKAYIILTSDNITNEELDEWCKSNDDLGNYQRPRKWEIVEKLPRTNTGKLNRSVLREREGLEPHQ